MMSYTGGCQCGAVRYTLRVPKLVVYACHCRECQRHTTSAFALSVPALKASVEITGQVEVYTRETDSGTTTRCHFCPICGTRMYHQSAKSPENITLKGGTFDDTSVLRPLAHVWVSRKQPWVILDETIPSYETQPDDLKAWRDALLADAAEE